MCKTSIFGLRNFIFIYIRHKCPWTHLNKRLFYFIRDRWPWAFVPYPDLEEPYTVFSWLSKPAETNCPYSPLKFIFNSDTSFTEGILLVAKLEPIEPISLFLVHCGSQYRACVERNVQNLSQCLSATFGEFKLRLVTKPLFFTRLIPFYIDLWNMLIRLCIEHFVHC